MFKKVIFIFKSTIDYWEYLCRIIKKKRQGIKKIANGEREILKSVIILNVNELCTPNKSIYVKLKKKKQSAYFCKKKL